MPLEDPVSPASVQRLLLRLGATPNYTGFQYAADAIWLALQDQRRLLLITKELYPAVASRYHTSKFAVERDIRTVISVIWKANPQLLKKLARYEIPEKPSASQFLSMITAALLLSRHRPEL